MTKIFFLFAIAIFLFFDSCKCTAMEGEIVDAFGQPVNYFIGDVPENNLQLRFKKNSSTIDFIAGISKKLTFYIPRLTMHMYSIADTSDKQNNQTNNKDEWVGFWMGDDATGIDIWKEKNAYSLNFYKDGIKQSSYTGSKDGAQIKFIRYGRTEYIKHLTKPVEIKNDVAGELFDGRIIVGVDATNCLVISRHEYYCKLIKK